MALTSAPALLPRASSRPRCVGVDTRCVAHSGRASAASLGGSVVSLRAARSKQSPRHAVVTSGLFGLGLPELVVIGGVVAVLFGPSKLPELGKSLGKTVKSFQTAAKARRAPMQAGCEALCHPLSILGVAPN